MGLWAMVYLWNKDSNNLQGIMVDYFKNWGEQEILHPREGWKFSFQKTFNIAIDDFYTEFDAFMAKPRAEQVSILKTNEEFIAAIFSPAAPIRGCGYFCVTAMDFVLLTRRLLGAYKRVGA
jgi:hypothetical protein